MTAAIEVYELVKRVRRRHCGLPGSTSRSHAENFFAFLGPNGAGKTTTINILCTLARPHQWSSACRKL
jgi:ABC-2 type transport system ATP-binding protein